MKVEINNNKIPPALSFKGPLDGVITQTLVTIDTNPMVNAALVDVFAMVIPRTYVDTKKRNKYAGAETLFRELTGTFIVCLSSGILAKGISHLYNRFKNPEISVNPDSWVSNDSLALLKRSWDKGQNAKGYVNNILDNISGIDGRKIVRLKDVNWNKVQFYDDVKWGGVFWQDKKFVGIQNRLKSKKIIAETLSGIIGENTDPKDAKQILGIIEHRIANALGADSSLNVKIDEKTLSTSLHNLLRDTYDMGKNVFVKGANINAVLEKLAKINQVKTLGALSLAALLGLTNQYVNRLITKKRTGTDAFVGDVDYKAKEKTKTKDKKQDKKRLWALKILASAGMIALAAAVMRIKNPKDFIKKLEFTSVITSGNAIKTVYTATLVGRFLASKNETELRESATRDYLGFLNWLVFGGFVSKGAANLLDKEQKNLFNIHKTGKGVKHLLDDISFKSHAEIAAKGAEFAKKNIWKLNLAHVAGLAYSTIALGFLLPLLNIAVTNNKHQKENRKKQH